MMALGRGIEAQDHTREEVHRGAFRNTAKRAEVKDIDGKRESGIVDFLRSGGVGGTWCHEGKGRGVYDFSWRMRSVDMKLT